MTAGQADEDNVHPEVSKLLVFRHFTRYGVLAKHEQCLVIAARTGIICRPLGVRTPRQTRLVN
jgi:hypothetical protein